MNRRVDEQRRAFEKVYGAGDDRFAFHDSADPLMRYVRDRRLNVALGRLAQSCPTGWTGWSALVVCGGVGGEGSFLANAGFTRVTVSDISPVAIEACRLRDPRLTGEVMDAERLAAPDASYDLVLVQDGLHHLSRPAEGLIEMLRVARQAVIVIEPYDGLVQKLLSEEWESNEGATTYVFRWRRRFFQEVVYSYLGAPPADLGIIRLWDQNVYVGRWAARFGRGGREKSVARATYAALRPFDRFGNAMVAVVVLRP
jgi:ubiquinone/menaquinone biosynthesis C-methylase UbiE